MSETIKNQDNTLLKRAYIFLEDKSWGNAKEYFERTLDADPENAQAYMGLLLVSMRASNIEELLETKKVSKWSGEEILFYEEDYFKKALKYADDEYIKEIENLKVESIYRSAVENMEKSFYDTAILGFNSIIQYKDSNNLKCECIYKRAIAFSKGSTVGKLKKAIDDLEHVLDYKDASEIRDRLLDKIEQIKKRRKMRIIVSTIVLVVLSLLFVCWANLRIMQNKMREKIIMENFHQKVFKGTSYVIDENFDFVDTHNKSFVDRYMWCDKHTFDFKEFEFKEKTVELSHEHSEFALYKNGWISTLDEWNTQKRYLYSIKVSFWAGKVILTFNNNNYVVEVDEKDEPIRFVQGDYNYTRNDIVETVGN
ncbi:MAG: hypothetical protein IJW15_01040 [Clostridia bacterium]|nr:hypothetical protein [Clostridia bacterium]